MNVLNLRGPEFLRLYFTLLAGATAAALLLRWWLRQPGGADDWPARRTPDEDELDPAEIAYLAGGPAAAADAAITRLVHEGTLKVKLGALALNGNLPRGVGPVERAVYRAVAYNGGGQIRQVRQDAAAAAEEIGEALRSRGLVPAPAQAALTRCVPMFVVLAVLGLGLVKVGVGVSRGRPVGFLVASSFFTLLVATLFAAVPPRTTGRGARLLRRLRAANQPLRTTAAHNSDGLGGDDLALAFALYGPAVLTGGSLWMLREAMRPPREGGSGCSSGGSSCGSSHSCGSSCGSSCGGGGGGDPAELMERLPLHRLAYVHVAGGAERDGAYHDSHAAPVPGGVLDLLEDLYARAQPAGVMLERDDHFPGEAELNRELDAIAAAVARGAARRETGAPSLVGVSHGQ